MAIALDQATRDKVKGVFGYSAVDASADPAMTSGGLPYGLAEGINTLESNMRSIIDQFGVDRILGLLADIDTLDEQIKEWWETVGINEVKGAVTLDSKAAFKQLWRERSKMVSYLANALSCHVNYDPAIDGLTGNRRDRGGSSQAVRVRY